MIFSGKKFKKEIEALPAMSSAEPLAPQDQARIKYAVLLAIARQDAAAPAGFWTRHRMLLRYSISAALGLSLVAGTAFASGSSIPGDILYPVKITAEKVRLSLAATDQSRAQLQASFARQRIAELQKLAAKTPAPAAPEHTAALPNTAGAKNNQTASSPPFAGRSRLEQQAREQASLEVNSALTALKNVQSNLKRRGDNKDAQTVANNISSLQVQAGAQNLLVNSGDDNAPGRDQNENRPSGHHKNSGSPHK